jgi:hypothetical protein
MAALTIPLFVSCTEIDLPAAISQAEKVISARRAAGHPSTYAMFRDHSHISQKYFDRHGRHVGVGPDPRIHPSAGVAGPPALIGFDLLLLCRFEGRARPKTVVSGIVGLFWRYP